MISKNKIEKIKNRFFDILRKIYSWKIFNPFRKHIETFRVKIEKSIRFELMVVIAICFVASFFFYTVARDVLSNNKSDATVVYNYENIKYSAKNLLSDIESQEGLILDNTDYFNNLFLRIEENGAKGYLADLDGNIIFKSANVNEDKVDIFALLTNSVNEDLEEGQERSYIFPLSIGENRCYFIYADTPKAEIQYHTYRVDNSFFALILSLLVFAILFIVITNKKMKYLDEIADGLKIIASEDINYRIREEGNDEIRNLASNINYMASEINNKIVAERRAEQTKADLITNVSHDLRTPLTSIMGYIGLVKEGKYENEDIMKEYLNIAFNKSEKLKMLIEDLFEYTKLNNSGISINKTRVNLTEFLEQLSEELMPLFEVNKLSLIKNLQSSERIIVSIDPDKMVRVFENLFSNAIKYSYKPGNINLSISKHKDDVIVEIRNKGDYIPKEKIEKLFDRFYRVEESRNESTGGTGLGLAISKNIITLHEGNIWAECYGNDISFYVSLKCE